MKRILLFLTVMLIGLSSANAQIEFMGVTIAGRQQELINNLKPKGFKYDKKKDCLHGKFMGEKVSLYINATDDFVDYISLVDDTKKSASDARNRFNQIVLTYETDSVNFESENAGTKTYIIDSDITAGEKYRAIFYAKPYDLDSNAMWEYIAVGLLDKYTEEEIQEADDNIKMAAYSLVFGYLSEVQREKTIWLDIEESNGKFYVVTRFGHKEEKEPDDVSNLLMQLLSD